MDGSLTERWDHLTGLAAMRAEVAGRPSPIGRRPAWPCEEPFAGLQHALRWQRFRPWPAGAGQIL